MLSKKKVDQNRGAQAKTKKTRHLWAGKAPEVSDSKPISRSKKESENKLIYRGTNSAGIIVDTSAGRRPLPSDDPANVFESQKEAVPQHIPEAQGTDVKDTGEVLSESDSSEEEIEEKEKRQVVDSDPAEEDDDLFGDVQEEELGGKERNKISAEINESENLGADLKPGVGENKGMIIEVPTSLPAKEEKKDTDAKSDDKSEASEESEEEESESEESANEEEPEPTPTTLLKPVFVRREERETIIEKEQKEIQQEQIKRKLAAKQEEKIKQTQELVKQAIENDNKSEDMELDDAMPNDEIDPDKEQEEYEKWKIRELKRVKRDLEEQQEHVKEQEEIERRRVMTDEQREAENKRLGSDKTEHKEGRQYNFMQKYYKLGPYYMDNAKKGGKYEILNRDYNAPLAEEKRDVSLLPPVMQKRRGEFGKRGQSKWTHLTNEDTTMFDPTWKVPESIAKKMQNRLGGYKGSNKFGQR